MNTITNLDDKIRFVTITDLNGSITNTGHREDVRNLLSFNESRQLLQLAVKSWKSRSQFQDKIGKCRYVVAVYDKLNRITIPFDDKHLIYLTVEPHADHQKIVEQITKITKK